MLPARHSSPPRSGTFRTDLCDANTWARYAVALTSLLDGAADELIAIDASGGLRDDLDLHELRQHLNANRLDSVRLRLPLGDVATRFTVTVRASDSLTSRSLSSRLVDAPAPKSPLWSGCYLA